MYVLCVTDRERLSDIGSIIGPYLELPFRHLLQPLRPNRIMNKCTLDYDDIIAITS